MRSHSFPADLELFEKNRHPSIQEMIHISECFGISYEKVFIRFQDLRSIANEHCEPEDICEKVRRFSQMYPKLSGNLDEIPALHVEFEKLVRFGGTQLPIGYVHLVMEKVELEPRVIREQFMEWFRRRTKVAKTFFWAKNPIFFGKNRIFKGKCIFSKKKIFFSNINARNTTNYTEKCFIKNFPKI